MYYNITGWTGGSVTYYSQCIFEDGSATGAQAYVTALTKTPQDLADIYGSNYQQLYGDVTVDPTSVSTKSVANPSRKSPWLPLLSFYAATFYMKYFQNHCWLLLSA